MDRAYGLGLINEYKELVVTKSYGQQAMTKDEASKDSVLGLRVRVSEVKG